MIWLGLYRLSRALHADPVTTTFGAFILGLWVTALLAGGALAFVWGKETE